MMMPILIAWQELPAPLTTLTSLRQAVLTDEKAGRVSTRLWSGTKASWGSTWGQRAFGVAQIEAEDTQAFGFRVPPDSTLPRYAGGSPFLVEAYRDGFPTYGIRRNGDAEFGRPLGFVYGSDGLCKNATVFQIQGGKWQELRLKARTKTLLARRLNFFAPARIGDFGQPWFKIAAQGYGTYWVDHQLNCVGPFGIVCKLSPDQKNDLKEMLGGRWG